MDWRDKIRDPDCDLCPLHEGAEFRCLMGSGTRKSEVMLIGEAPGAREDEEHQAFVGAAGQLLDKLLKEHAGLSRNDCYITNVAKCRPPSNRTPDRKEMKVCVENYLIPEIAKVNPSYVLLLGNSALQGVIGRSGITKHRGTRWDLEDFVAMATFHPAAMLRNPRYGEALAADLLRFGRLVQGIDDEPKTRVKIIRTAAHLKWLLRHLKSEPEITYDIETNGLQEWRPDAKLVSIAFTWEEGHAAFLPLWHDLTPWKDPQKVVDAFGPFLSRKNRHHIAQNGKFDSRWLKEYGSPVVQTFDTMLAAHMLDENRPKGLKHLSQVILGAGAYDLGDEIKKAHEVPLHKLAIYNGKDTDYTHRLRKVFKKQLAAEPRIARVFKFLMMPASNALVDVERLGIQVDWERHVERTAQAKAIRDTIEEALIKTVPRRKREDFNFNSPDKVSEWLFKDLGYEPLELTKTGKPSTKESVLLQLAKESKVAAALLKHRKWNKRITTYLNPWLTHMDSDLRMHPSYKLYGTVTGRLSASDPNLQQVPRDPFMRGILGAKAGHVLIQADYSQIELRIAAMLAHEKRMARAFAAGEDLHLKTAMETTGKMDISKEERKKAKAVNFGFLFAMGWEKFITYARDNYDVDFTPAEAQAVRERFFAAYPALRPWHDRQRRLVRRYHRVSSPLGRVRHLPDVLSGDKGVRSEAERQAINSPVQSTASDLMLIALVLCWEAGIPIVGTIHDALLAEEREDNAEETAAQVKKIMEEDALDYARRYFGMEMTIPIVADVTIGRHWGEEDV